MASGRATLEFYRHNVRELGHELPTPSNLTINVKLDLRTPAGVATVKQRMRAQLAWLMEEGGSLPVETGPDGLATRVDTDRLEVEFAAHRDAVEAQSKEQSRILYDMPSREELRQVREIAGETVRSIRDLVRRRGSNG